MSQQESTVRRPSMAIHNIASLVIIVGICLMIVIAWRPIIYPLLVGAVTGAPLPLDSAPAPATVATPRPLPAQVQPAPVQAPAAPLVVLTPYTLPTAQALADEAYRQAIEQAELNAPALPNESKIVEQPADAPVNADWCRGAHKDNPECQPGNGSKEEK